MDVYNINKRYRPIYRDLKIGTKAYAVLDLALAQQRALVFLNNALDLLSLDSITQAQQQHANQCLLTATDLGSKDAPYLFALQMFNPDVEIPLHPEEAISFLKIAAERGNANAAYRLATCYAAMGRFPEIEEYGFRFLHGLSARERASLAERYFDVALKHDHQEAIEDMIIAYAYGRGYISKNAERFVNVCEQLVKRANQAVTLGYGAWLAGMTVEGDEPLTEAVDVPADPAKSLDLLLTASRGQITELCQHALHLICLGVINGVWNLKFISKRLTSDAHSHHQLLAFYFAWYSIPLHMRPATPALIDQYPLTPLAELVEPNEEIAVQFLNSALFGEDEIVAVEAKTIFSDVFAQGYLDVADELMLQEV